MMLKFLQIPVCKKPQSGKINQTSLNLLPGYDTLPNYIIGDPAYPLTPYCMKEYQTCVENKQDVFNNLLRNAEATLLKKRLCHRHFAVNFAKFLRTLFLQNTSGGCFWKCKKSNRVCFWEAIGRWRVPAKTVDLKSEIVTAVVYSCFVLHNFYESKNYLVWMKKR